MFRLVRRLVGLAVLALSIYLGVTFVQVWLVSRRDGAQKADAIVVFGAAQYNGVPSPVLRARLDHAADLYERKVASTVMVTGGRQPGDRGVITEASASADYLAETYGIKQSHILREDTGTNSWQSMASAAKELQKKDKVRVVLVTDPFHAARVEAIADELGLDATVSPTRTSPIRGMAELRHFARETLAVAAGRAFGFRRVMGVDRVVDKVREAALSG